MVESLLLVGAGGMGREVLDAVRATNAVEPRWRVEGFLDDRPDLPGEVAGVPVLGPVDEIGSWPRARIVLCTGHPDRPWSRALIAARLDLPAERYATIVHPSASLGTSVTVGHGSVLLAGAVATASVTIGDHVVVMPGSVFTHDDVLAHHTTFGAGTLLAGGVVVDTGCYVGSGAVVRQGVTLGSWSLVGMGAVVLDDVPAATVWVGSPARLLRSVEVPADVLGSTP